METSRKLPGFHDLKKNSPWKPEFPPLQTMKPTAPTAGQTLWIDTREPWPHPWQRHLPEVTFQRRGMETGDICLSGNPLAVVERKTVADFLGSITSGRPRFNDELRRSRHLDSFHIVVEGSLGECLMKKRGMSEASLFGTIAAFERRGFSIIFAGSERYAAQIAWRILAQPLTEANALVKDCSKIPEHTPEPQPTTDHV